CGDDFRTRVTFAETVRVEVRGENAKASHAFDDAVALTANSVDVGGLCQCFEQQRRAGAWRVDDENRAIKTRINRYGNNVRGAYGRRRDVGARLTRRVISPIAKRRRDDERHQSGVEVGAVAQLHFAGARGAYLAGELVQRLAITRPARLGLAVSRPKRPPHMGEVRADVRDLGE